MKPPTATVRHQPTRWDKFNRLEPRAIVMPLEAGDRPVDDAPLEVAGRPEILDKIQSALSQTEPRSTRNERSDGD